MRRIGGVLLGTVLAGSTIVGTGASVAHAATLPAYLVKFKHCPISNPAVTLCVYGAMTGTFTIKSTTLSTPSPATLSLGFTNGANGLSAVVPTDGTPALQSPPIPVSILGLPSLPSPLNVTATPTLVGTPTVNLINILTGAAPAVSVSLDVSLNNALLGSNCTIGTPSDPIAINLTTGTTSPPPPNQPITGAPGYLVTNPTTGVGRDTGVVLVDNAFAVPGANGCGLLGALDPALDTVEGLPSAAGNNTGSFSGKVFTVAASVLRRYLG
jgi:hypothetical protein